MKIIKSQTLFIILTIFFSLSLPTKANNDRLIIDSFSNGVDEKGIPLEWELNEKEGIPIIKLEKEEDAYVLHFVSEKSSFGLTKKINIDIKEYPYINFRWKVIELPENGDFRKKETDDQAAQLYVAFGRFRFTAKIVGYLWENKVPQLTTGVGPAWSKIRIIVLQSGVEKTGQWIYEKRNIYNDYKDLFEKEPPNAKLISLYINSQHTKSKAESYFGEIYFSKK